LDRNLIPHIESLIFASKEPINEQQIQQALALRFDLQIDVSSIRDAINQLIIKYRSDEYAFEIIAIAGGYRFVTKGAYYDTIAAHLQLLQRRKLTRAALETLAIIAYRQPVTKPYIEKLRGVKCDYILQKLLEKELIQIAGRADEPGRPLLYTTTHKFLDHFGIRDIRELPKLSEIQSASQQIGHPDEIMSLQAEEDTAPTTTPATNHPAEK